MSKYIKFPADTLDGIRQEFEEALGKQKFADGKFTFTRTVGTVNRKATVYFEELAWLKMLMLVKACDKEVGWHGVATRGEDGSKDEYIVHDILVYPQEVTEATVHPDPAEYSNWMMQIPDETFDRLSFQGHSHVNLGVSPSTTDLDFYAGILDQLDGEMFYIFLILNKRGEHTVKIYDMKKNVLFETADVSVEVLPDGTGVMEFIADAKKQVRDKAYKPTYPLSGNGVYYGRGYSGNGNYGGGNYGGGNYGGYPKTGNVTPIADAVKKTDPKPEPPSNVVRPKKRKGKRKNKPTGSFMTQPPVYDSYEDDPWYPEP